MIAFIRVPKNVIALESICMHCGNSCEDNDKFCSQNCRDSHIIEITVRINEATQNDKSHTKKISEDN
ncbi:hypothetical protein DSQ20_07310 [Nitrosarchaeum sp. AC2]|nr:hypothetical protein DSQ20_07310 [Nitrosarchaeum sp. AC2]